MKCACGKEAVVHMDPVRCKKSTQHHYCARCWEDALRHQQTDALYNSTEQQRTLRNQHKRKNQ